MAIILIFALTECIDRWRRKDNVSFLPAIRAEENYEGQWNNKLSNSMENDDIMI